MTQTATKTCQHHWVLTEPQAEVIHAVCKICRASREYPSRLEDTERFDDYRELTTACQAPLSSIYGPLDEEH